MNAIVTEKIPQLVELCKKYRVARMYLFGSAARDDFDPETEATNRILQTDPMFKLNNARHIV